MQLHVHQVKNSLVLYREHPLVFFKPALPLACLPSHPLAQQKSHPAHLKENLIKAARAIRVVCFGARTVFVVLAGSLILFTKFHAEEASDIVKDFCYQEAGRRNFKIKTEEGSYASLSTMGNTLYVPKGDICGKGLHYTLKDKMSYERERHLIDQNWGRTKLSIESQIQHHQDLIKKLKVNSITWEHENTKLSVLQELYKRELEDFVAKQHRIEEELKEIKRRMDLFKGILDHEMGHLNHYDRYRLPLILFGSVLGMEYLWEKIRTRAESNFKKSTLISSSTIKNVAHIGGNWLTKLVIPTALYTCTFFAARQFSKKSIEAQADANIRDDLDVLTEMERFFRQEAKESRKRSTVIKSLSVFFDTHPSDENRADYFSHRIDELKKGHSI